MAVDFRELALDLIAGPEKPVVGLTGSLAGGAMVYGANKAGELIDYGSVFLPPDLSPVPAIAYGFSLVAGCYIARFLSCMNRDTNGSMAAPRVRNIAAAPYERCTGRTNTGHNAAIFVSDYCNPGADENQGKSIAENMRDAGILQRYLTDHGEFLGHPADKTWLVYSAKANDVRDAFRDPSVSSVVLLGHSSVGEWYASDKDLDWQDIAGFVEEAGHCKNGFGFKGGCNTVHDGTRDRHQVLAPAYSHPGHDGSLYVMRGSPAKSKNSLPGSRVSHGVGISPKLFRLVPEAA